MTGSWRGPVCYWPLLFPWGPLQGLPDATGAGGGPQPHGRPDLLGGQVELWLVRGAVRRPRRLSFPNPQRPFCSRGCAVPSTGGDGSAPNLSPTERSRRPSPKTADVTQQPPGSLSVLWGNGAGFPGPAPWGPS